MLVLQSVATIFYLRRIARIFYGLIELLEIFADYFSRSLLQEVDIAD